MQIGQLILKGIRRLASAAVVVGGVGFVAGLLNQEMAPIVMGAIFLVFGGVTAYLANRRIIVPAVKPQN